MDLTALLAACYEDLNYQSSPASAVTTRLTRYLNEGLHAIVAEPGLARVVDSDGPFSIASVADQARYVLPDAYTQIRHITERTNDTTLRMMTLDQYRRIAPDPTAVTGTPDAWVPIGRVAVAKQPSDASELFIDSTSASDTNTCYIEGIVTGGYRRTASVSMTGTTAVSLSASITDWIEVTRLSLSAAALGTVTLHEDASGGTELARIPIGQTLSAYQAFYLYPTPESVITYLVDARRDLRDLANLSDEPPLPRDFHPMLVKYACYREWEHKDDLTKAQAALSAYQTWLSRLKYWLLSTGDTPLVMRNGGERFGRSRLGPWYPAGSGW
jgi:hypothetical protein